MSLLLVFLTLTVQAQDPSCTAPLWNMVNPAQCTTFETSYKNFFFVLQFDETLQKNSFNFSTFILYQNPQICYLGIKNLITQCRKHKNMYNETGQLVHVRLWKVRSELSSRQIKMDEVYQQLATVLIIFVSYYCM